MPRITPIYVVEDRAAMNIDYDLLLCLDTSTLILICKKSVIQNWRNAHPIFTTKNMLSSYISFWKWQKATRARWKEEQLHPQKSRTIKIYLWDLFILGWKEQWAFGALERSLDVLRATRVRRQMQGWCQGPLRSWAKIEVLLTCWY